MQSMHIQHTCGHTTHTVFHHVHSTYIMLTTTMVTYILQNISKTKDRAGLLQSTNLSGIFKASRQTHFVNHLDLSNICTLKYCCKRFCCILENRERAWLVRSLYYYLRVFPTNSCYIQVKKAQMNLSSVEQPNICT